MNPIALLGTLSILLFYLPTLLQYYRGTSHLETFGGTWALSYFLLMLIPLVVYFVLWGRKEWSRIRLITAIGYFFWVLLLTSVFTFSRIGSTSISGVVLFFSLLKYTILPLIIGIVSLGFGTWVLHRVKLLESLTPLLRIPAGLGIGWSLFVLTLSIAGFFGWYTLFVFYGLIVALSALSYKEIGRACADFWKSEFVSEKTSFPILHQIRWWLNGGLLLSLYAVLSSNLVNIVRPYPIGWDDLGAYMNFPKLMAFAESTGHQWIVFWQTFTGIWFLHESATQAFFLNSFGSILAIIGIWTGVRYLTQKGGHIFSLPLFAVTVFTSLPMIVFQQAKDMKLDSWLMGISLLALLFVFEGFRQNHRWQRLGIYCIAGWLMGVAFSIKFTSLMLILGALGMIWYRAGKLLWFLGYIAIFIGSFTGLRLWNFLNINYPQDNPGALNIFSLGMILVGVVCIGISLRKKSVSFWKEYGILPTVALLIGVFTTLLPWAIKNSIEALPNSLNVASILGGDVQPFVADYTTIHSPETLKKIEESTQKNLISSTGTTQNEDLGRYFGYEGGINNYLKLPSNLTFQKNQDGEFTNIGYLFLALLPWVLLFRLKKRSSLILYGVYLIGFFILCFFSDTPWSLLGNVSITQILSRISVPLGYGVIVALWLIPLIALHLDSKEVLDEDTPEHEATRNFCWFFSFMSLYTILFVIAAFGIVWYGIVMYFGFLAIFAYCTSEELEPKMSVQFILFCSLLLCIILPHFILSCLPHAWNNLPKDSMEYKLGNLTEEEAVFSGRPEYIPILIKLNLANPNEVIREIQEKASGPTRELLGKYPDATLEWVLYVLWLAEQVGKQSKQPDGIALAQEARSLKQLAFKRILHPPLANKNTTPIYRAGTFLTYYISENRKRFYEDSLLNNFDTYIRGKNIDESIENMKRLGMKYLLLDLNAATIDRDPRHDLSRRYEAILDTVRSGKLRLIATDSPCLQLGLSLPKDPSYLHVAGVNYNSYLKNEKGEDRVITASAKLNVCATNLAQIIFERRVTDSQFPLLKRLSDYALSQNPSSKEEVIPIIQPFISRTWMAAFEILP